jgi:hypothetical protein
MKYFYKLLFAAFLMPVISIAQSNYKPGYVVTLKGDTLTGLIDYREWNNNPKNIRFKNSHDNVPVNYSTGDSHAFAVTGREYFERFVLPVS